MQYFTSQPLILKHLQPPLASKSFACNILRVSNLYSIFWPDPSPVCRPQASDSKEFSGTIWKKL